MNKIFIAIGLEVHCQILTKTKMFSSADNSSADNYTLGYPGTLPVINKEAVTYAIKMAAALNCKINNISMFDRKHYFYRDLPKGYQITQNEQPLAVDGKLTLPNSKQVKIERLHIEEDAGKSISINDGVLVDYKRAGIPLIEIVTSPAIKSPEDAALFVKEIRNIAVWLGLNNGDMQNAEIRCDANISISKDNSVLGNKVEIKNINSFKFIKDALSYEIRRQKKLLESDEVVTNETRRYNEKDKTTISMRIKETETDYRYLPDPDLPPLQVEEDEIIEIKKNLPVLPFEYRKKLTNEYLFDKKDAEILIEDKILLSYYLNYDKYSINNRKLFNALFISKLRLFYKEYDFLPKAEDLIYLYKGINESKIPKSKFTYILEKIHSEKKTAEHIVASENLFLVNDSLKISEWIKQVEDEYPEKYFLFKSGNIKLKGFIIGKVNELSDGLANPIIINQLLDDELHFQQ